jgi:hypothetical protein
MNEDIGGILKGWRFRAGELGVRKITGLDGKSKIQIRMDLGLMQLEWNGRPDADRPEGFSTLLEYYQDRRKVVAPSADFSLSREDCWALAQEAMQYYWRRISFFELKEYRNAEEDALHNINILDMCLEFAENDEDRQVAEQYRPFVTAHRVQARALALLDEQNFDAALKQIQQGIREIEDFLAGLENFEDAKECQELRFLREWEREIESTRPLSLEEQLNADLEAAVEEEKFELAASLRDRLRAMDSNPAPNQGEM